MNIALVISLVMSLVGCSSSSRYSNYGNSNSYTQSYKSQPTNTYIKPDTQNNYNQSNYVKTAQAVTSPKSSVTVSNFERLSYEDLVRFEPDCEKELSKLHY